MEFLDTRGSVQEPLITDFSWFDSLQDRDSLLYLFNERLAGVSSLLSEREEDLCPTAY